MSIDFAKSLSDSGYDETLILDLETVRKLTDNDIEVIEKLKNGDIVSVSGLADELDRDQANVSRNLQKLYKLDIVSIKNEGRTVIPKLKHNYLAIKPLEMR